MVQEAFPYWVKISAKSKKDENKDTTHIMRLWSTVLTMFGAGGLMFILS